jgi:hypothetical protein
MIAVIKVLEIVLFMRSRNLEYLKLSIKFTASVKANPRSGE